MNYSDAADDKNAGVANYGALSGSQSMNRASSSHFHMNTSAGYSLIDRVTCAKSFERETWCVVALCLFCVIVLFFGSGGAALFEPDEGRNAEVAREILLLDDWITPHYDFIPRLDKPVFFYGLVALSFKVFGLSEWAARLPSVLAALGCLSLTYVLARSIFGGRAALWSVLILVTSIEFFALSRIVILDMVLTMFITLSLACFWLGHLATGPRRKCLVLLMYVSMGAATLVKGPIGLVLPSAVIFFYLLLSRKWALLAEMKLPLGIPLFLIVAASWYVRSSSVILDTCTTSSMRKTLLGLPPRNSIAAGPGITSLWF